MHFIYMPCQYLFIFMITQGLFQNLILLYASLTTPSQKITNHVLYHSYLIMKRHKQSKIKRTKYSVILYKKQFICQNVTFMVAMKVSSLIAFPQFFFQICFNTIRKITLISMLIYLLLEICRFMKMDMYNVEIGREVF